MAGKGHKPTQFKKGQSGNPNGKPKLPEDVRKGQQLTNEEFIRVANKYLAMDRQKIHESLQNPEASMLEMLVGGIIAKAVKDTDYQRASFILDRTIGKVKDTVEVQVPRPTIIRRLNGEEVVLGATIEKTMLEE